MTDTETVQYSITQVANMLELPQHVLRMWESQFSTIAPVRGRNGRRAYTAETIQAIKQIQRLLHEDGLTLQEVREKLDNTASSSASSSAPSSVASTGVTLDTDKLHAILAAIEAASAALARR